MSITRAVPALSLSTASPHGPASQSAWDRASARHDRRGPIGLTHMQLHATELELKRPQNISFPRSAKEPDFLRSTDSHGVDGAVVFNPQPPPALILKGPNSNLGPEAPAQAIAFENGNAEHAPLMRRDWNLRTSRRSKRRPKALADMARDAVYVAKSARRIKWQSRSAPTPGL